MTERLIDPDEHFKARYRYIVMAHWVRGPLACGALLLALIVASKNVAAAGGIYWDVSIGASTHPTTAVCIVLLAIGLIQHRTFQRISSWQIGISSGVLMFLLSTLLLRWVFLVNLPIQTPDALPMGALGTDTAFILALLFGSYLARRSHGRLGLCMAIVATSCIAIAFIGFSFGRYVFRGQMAVTTLVALIPLSMSVLTLYAHRPLARIILLSGQVGLRTRTTIIVGFLVPWLGGLVLHRVVGTPDRVIPVEAIIMGITIFCMAIVAVGSGLFHERVDRTRRRLARRLAELAIHDRLTGMLNRNGVSSELANRWDVFQDTGIDQCVLLLDLDNFKQINDRFGHDQGDRVLSAIGRLIRPHLRAGDAVGRWGGEEFLIMVHDLAPADAAKLAERLRQAIEALPTFLAGADQEPGTIPYDVTGSLGVSEFRPTDTTPDQAIKRADVALYIAKANGRNRVAADLSEMTQAA